jgi:hypothetical protein
VSILSIIGPADISLKQLPPADDCRDTFPLSLFRQQQSRVEK